MNFITFKINFSDLEALFQSISKSYSIDFIIKVNQSLIVIAIFFENELVIKYKIFFLKLSFYIS